MLSFASNVGLENPLIRTINTRRIWSVCDAFCGLLAFKETAIHGNLIKRIPVVDMLNKITPQALQRIFNRFYSFLDFYLPKIKLN